MQQADIMAAQIGEEESGEEELPFDQTGYDPPRLVADAYRLQTDMNVLEMLTSNDCPHSVGSERAVRERFCMDSAMLQKGVLVGVLTSEMEFVMSLGMVRRYPK
jgi:hypothetical protein